MLQRHVHGVAAVSVGLPEQEVGAEMVYEAAVSTKVDGQIFIGVAISQERIIGRGLAFDGLQNPENLEGQESDGS